VAGGTVGAGAATVGALVGRVGVVVASIGGVAVGAAEEVGEGDGDELAEGSGVAVILVAGEPGGATVAMTAPVVRAGAGLHAANGPAHARIVRRISRAGRVGRRDPGRGRSEGSDRAGNRVGFGDSATRGASDDAVH